MLGRMLGDRQHELPVPTRPVRLPVVGDRVVHVGLDLGVAQHLADPLALLDECNGQMTDALFLVAHDETSRLLTQCACVGAHDRSSALVVGVESRKAGAEYCCL